MPKFYFDFYDSLQASELDTVGLVFDDIDAAEAEAASALAHYLKDSITFSDRVVRIVVRNEDGAISQLQLTAIKTVSG